MDLCIGYGGTITGPGVRARIDEDGECAVYQGDPLAVAEALVALLPEAHAEPRSRDGLYWAEQLRQWDAAGRQVYQPCE